ncbi:hypothetical protein AAVH_14943 [Aphelenchoides avenae]|nr:hypothetical protein AAVH_14943 [Aphelenchus avenae]
MYLYQPNRKPQHQFNYDFMLRGPRPHGEATGPQPGLDQDECFQRNLAVKLEGRVMCNESVPMANASVFIVVNTTSEEPRLVVIGRLDNEGRYEEDPVLGDVASRSEIQALTLVVTNICDGTNQPGPGPGLG